MGLCKVPWKLATHNATNYTRYTGFKFSGEVLIQLDRICSKSTVAIYMKHFVFSTMMR